MAAEDPAMFHKPTVLADAQWQSILLEVTTKTFGRDGVEWMNHLVTHVYALSPGKPNGRAWIGILGIRDSACPYFLFKHRRGEIPASERSEVPGNNLAFIEMSSDPYRLMEWLNWGGDKETGCSTDAQRVLKPLCGDRKMTHKDYYAHARLMRRRICNMEGMGCQRLAVLVMGDKWMCEKHVLPVDWSDRREAILRDFEGQANRIEESDTHPEAARRMAKALRSEARRLRRLRCWVVKKEPAAEDVRA